MAVAGALGSKQVLEAYQRIQGLVHRTPVMRSRSLDERAGAALYLKCENLQRTGSFKFRGASNAVASLSDEERERGVVTHSSGNHAQALACAAGELGVKCTVVMPETAPQVKREATMGYGAQVVSCRPTLAAREEATAQVMEKEGALLVHPYDDARIVAGQASVVLELLQEVPHLDVVVAPVGGGGLLSGSALAAKWHRERTGSMVRVVGAEPRGADDAKRSLESGVRVESHEPDTIADGLLTTLGRLPFEVLKEEGVEVVTVGDDEVLAAMRLLWERTKLVVEPSGAVSLAAVLSEGLDVEGRSVGVVLSGGNVDLGGFFAGLGNRGG
jgi:threonine dehydratase